MSYTSEQYAQRKQKEAERKVAEAKLCFKHLLWVKGNKAEVGRRLPAEAAVKSRLNKWGKGNE